MARRFQTTRWTLVLKARDVTSEESRAALSELCEAYWYPLYAFVRREGHQPDDAMDLTQGYFATLLEKDYLKDVRPEAGRFRSFLLTSLKHFLYNDWDRRKALKRGGGIDQISLDACEAERRFALEPTSGETPENLYERQWAATVLDRTLASLEAEYTESDTAERFRALRGYLIGDSSGDPYSQIAEKLDMSIAAVKVAVHRLRKRFGQTLRVEIAEIVADPKDVDDEIRYLLTVVESRN